MTNKLEQRALAQQTSAPCPCGLSTCIEPWEPGCGLGNSEQHAIAVPSAPKPVAWVFPLRHGSGVQFPKPVKPDDWDDDEDEREWYCHPLYAAPPAPRSDDAPREQECEECGGTGMSSHIDHDGALVSDDVCPACEDRAALRSSALQDAEEVAALEGDDGAPREAAQEPVAPWQPIALLPANCDDLFWFLRGDVVDGPRPPQHGGYDADEWDYFAPCESPAIDPAPLRPVTDAEVAHVANALRVGGWDAGGGAEEFDADVRAALEAARSRLGEGA